MQPDRVAWMSSLASLLAQWFGPRSAGPPLRTPRAAHGAAATTEYPPVDRGLPAIAVAEVIAPHAEWLKRLRYAYGAEAATFERDIGGVVERYARYVHLVPATPDSHFRHAGGLFRMGLEIGFYALQATDGAIFSGRQTITQRSALEPRWRYATFLAGLCSELYGMSHVTVTNDRGDEWPAYLQPLSTWLQDTGSRRYHLRWQPRPEDTRALGVVAMSHIVAPAILHYLAQGNSVVIPHFMASLSGTVLEREANTLDQLVRRAAALVIERDLSATINLPVQPPPSVDVERHLVAAMRCLVAQRRWMPNADTSPLWYGEDGLFLLWPQAAADMREGLRDDQSSGVTLKPDAIAATLVAAGIVERRLDGSSLWDIYVGDQATNSTSLKLASPSLLLSATDAAATPMARQLLKPAVRDTTGQPRPADAQLALRISEPRPSQATASVDSTQPQPREQSLASPVASPHEGVTLVAPARLNPAVRDALRQIIATLDSPTLPLAAFVIERGVFVPLQELARRSVDPALAVRALSDARMLASDPTHPQSKTCSLTFDDEPVLGVVLAPQCIHGLDERAFSRADRALRPAP